MHGRIIITVAALLAIVAIMLLSRVSGPADNGYDIPAAEYAAPEQIIMSRGVAPQICRAGIATYESFAEALARAKAAVPDELVELAGRAIWGEAGGIQDEAQRAAVVWCACNRADAWDMTIDDVLNVEAFHGLAIRGTVPEQHVELARDVLARWTLEHEGWQDVGRTIAPEYLYFYGDGNENIFTVQMHRGEAWDWNLADPYDGEMGAEISF